MTIAFYEQKTGRFVICDYDDGGVERAVYETVGYSGRGAHKNNPESQHVRRLGPIPRGVYDIYGPFDHPRLGRLCFDLVFHFGNRMFGRSGFMIHGDSKRKPGDASSGCIILHRAAREAIVNYGPRLLYVEPVPPTEGEDLTVERSETVGTSDT